ncbi:butyrate kinase [Carboxylicivirga sp. N1Y90]|uniref:butyrate kinase n=1 Tax=Carboxylicivirga fragile TaxID=3417571 RepID=UPI003D350016|nr:butyrate kinase [Marinilabiliaceae bacterium N1Y90]
MNNEIVIVINPGSTSTKIAIYNRKTKLGSKTIGHYQSDLDQFERIGDQLEYRFEIIRDTVNSFFENNTYKVVGVVGRGGIVKPLSGGTYKINSEFLYDAANGTYGDHASNLGSLLADRLKDEFGLKDSYTVDPVSSSNISPIAEISGVPGIKRNGRGHPLNMKMTARKVALMQNIPFEKTNYVVAHLGGGISIAHIQGGKIVDINDALLGMGPFSPNRAGAIPLRGIMKLCTEMTYDEVANLLSKNSGLKGYLGKEDLRDVIQLVESGHENATLIYNAFVYQISKEIGAYFAATKGQAQAIIATGGIAFNEKFITDLKSYVGCLTEFHVYPGENEMEALAEGAFRVIDKVEIAQTY